MGFDPERLNARLVGACSERLMLSNYHVMAEKRTRSTCSTPRATRPSMST